MNNFVTMLVFSVICFIQIIDPEGKLSTEAQLGLGFILVGIGMYIWKIKTNMNNKEVKDED